MIYDFEKWMPGPPGSHKGTQGNIALIALLVSAGGLAAITAQVIGLRGSLEKIQKDKKLMAAEQANMSKLRTVKQLFNFPKGTDLPASDTNLPAVYPDPYFRTAATKADVTLRSTTGGSASWALWGGSTSPAGSPNFYGNKLAISSISPETSDLARIFAGTTVPATVMGPVTSALPVSPDVAVSQLNSNAVPIGEKVYYYRPATLDLAVNTSYQKGSLEEASTRKGPLRQLALKARLTLQAPPPPTCRITVDKSGIDTGKSVRATMRVTGIAFRGVMFRPHETAAAAEKTIDPNVYDEANSIFARDVVLMASDLILTTTSYPSESQQVTGNVLSADLSNTVACTSSSAVTVKGPTPPPPPPAPPAPPRPCELWRCQNTIALTPGHYPTYDQPNCPGTITLWYGTVEHGVKLFKITHNAGGTGYFYANNPASEQIAGYSNDALTAPTVTCNNGTLQ
ncbi:MAG: hypothetical protein EBU49_06360 [Proteobacteria bacterium]|nr:hypothetical protein [Pseudomonadota bacterium]